MNGFLYHCSLIYQIAYKNFIAGNFIHLLIKFIIHSNVHHYFLNRIHKAITNNVSDEVELIDTISSTSDLKLCIPESFPLDTAS